ncbi:hypothetical protein DL770_002682 [Monosporascus sp. CRB-9-2]|nr:hypothetical protein DL770_002682 [Monosporascus sp. CRB-9-2]
MSGPEEIPHEEYLRLRWRQRDKFDFYRRGIPWSGGLRRQQDFGGLGNRIFPKRGKPGTGPNPANLPRYQSQFKLNPNHINFDELGTKDIVPGNEAVKLTMIKDKIREMKLGFGITKRFEYKQALGAGGFGLTMWMLQHDYMGNFECDVVVKMNIEPERGDLYREMRCQSMFRSSEHMVQLAQVDTNEFIPARERTLWLQAKAAEAKNAIFRTQEENELIAKMPEPLDAMVMEFVPNGDLSTFIKRVNHLQTEFPGMVLWKFFLCLIRMCIGLAYPVEFIPANQGRDNKYPIMENIPDDQGPTRIVHFDLDPKNIFVGRAISGSNEHSFSPILRLGDFGLTVEVEDEKPDQYYEQLRSYGKYGFLAPEQFCEDWDYLVSNSNSVRTHHIAGNYGPHTNIWAVGLTMECLITGCRPLQPVRATQIFDETRGVTYMTCGEHLLSDPKYDYIDRDLRRIVAHCQAYYPKDRPGFQELEEAVLLAINSKKYPHTEQDIIEWFDRILPNTKPPPPPESAARPMEVDNKYSDDVKMKSRDSGRESAGRPMEVDDKYGNNDVKMRSRDSGGAAPYQSNPRRSPSVAATARGGVPVRNIRVRSEMPAGPSGRAGSPPIINGFAPVNRFRAASPGGPSGRAVSTPGAHDFTPINRGPARVATSSISRAPGGARSGLLENRRRASPY